MPLDMVETRNSHPLAFLENQEITVTRYIYLKNSCLPLRNFLFLYKFILSPVHKLKTFI